MDFLHPDSPVGCDGRRVPELLGGVPGTPAGGRPLLAHGHGWASAQGNPTAFLRALVGSQGGQSQAHGARRAGLPRPSGTRSRPAAPSPQPQRPARGSPAPPRARALGEDSGSPPRAARPCRPNSSAPPLAAAAPRRTHRSLERQPPGPGRAGAGAGARSSSGAWAPSAAGAAPAAGGRRERGRRTLSRDRARPALRPSVSPARPAIGRRRRTPPQ